MKLICTKHKHVDMWSFDPPCKLLACAIVHDLSAIAKSVHSADMAVINMLVWLCVAAEYSITMHCLHFHVNSSNMEVQTDASFNANGTAGQVCPPAEHQGRLALAVI